MSAAKRVAQAPAIENATQRCFREEIIHPNQDSPLNCPVADFQFAKARLFGTKANLGDTRKVTMEMF